jgi:hypothetical protein
MLTIELLVEIQGKISCGGDQTKEKSRLMAVLVTWDQGKYAVLAEAQDKGEEYKRLFSIDAQCKCRCFIEEINIY